jgi:hypothetical protein
MTKLKKIQKEIRYEEVQVCLFLKPVDAIGRVCLFHYLLRSNASFLSKFEQLEEISYVGLHIHLCFIKNSYAWLKRENMGSLSFHIVFNVFNISELEDVKAFSMFKGYVVRV